MPLSLQVQNPGDAGPTEKGYCNSDITQFESEKCQFLMAITLQMQEASQRSY